MKLNNDYSHKQYHQIHDFSMKSVLDKRANGVFKFAGIDVEIISVIQQEFRSIDLIKTNRVDIVGDGHRRGQPITAIMECHSRIPTKDDILRFAQYITTVFFFKNNKVELYILCLEEIKEDKIEIIINDDSKIVMNIISLKNFKAEEIFKNVENKLKNNDAITDADIAALQLIAYTSYTEPAYKILARANKLHENSDKNLDINEKDANHILFDILSGKMLTEDEYEKYTEETNMSPYPGERFYYKKGINKGRAEGRDEGINEGINKGKLEVALNLLKEGFNIEDVVRITNLKKEEILKGK